MENTGPNPQPSPDRRWIEVKVAIPPQSYDAVSYALMEQGANGTWETPEGIIAYFSLEDDRAADLTEIRLRNIRQFVDDLPGFGLPAGAGTIHTRERSEDSWADAWKKYFKPLRVGRNIVIRPTWHEYNQMPDDIVIDLDPGMAFGTGMHETTRLCISLLENHVKAGDTVYDIGTGSGILSIVAAKLGAAQVIGVDTDPAAVKIARENAEANGQARVTRFLEGDFRKLESGPADLIVCNIVAQVIGDMANDIHAYLKPTGTMIASGIIAHRAEWLIHVYEEAGWRVSQQQRENDWVALTFKRGGDW